MRKLLTVLAIFIAIAALWILGRDEMVRRAAFDIGSGSIKCVVADVNTATGKVVKEHLRINVKADFVEKLTGRADERIPPAMMAEGMTLMLQLKTRARNAGAEEYAAVATEAFRMAKNGRDFAKRLTEEAGIPTRVIGVDEEALLGIVAARLKKDIPKGPVAVWDVGGGSMQITLIDDKPVFFYSSKLGSIPFKNLIVEEIQNKPGSSPNPISYAESDRALQRARAEAARIPEKEKRRLSSGEFPVLGIGPVHNRSILPQVQNKAPYTGQDIAYAITSSLNKTDSEIGGAFAPTQVSNLILILGFMQELGIMQVEPVRVTLADGLLVSQRYWQ
ncbi:Ppx/GppA phosphatase family protein [Salidesulfovibrio brasiliensis]